MQTINAAPPSLEQPSAAISRVGVIPKTLLVLAVLLTLTTLPSVVPIVAEVFGFGVPVGLFFWAMLYLWALATKPKNTPRMWIDWIWIAAIAVWSIAGYFNGHDIRWLVSSVQNPVLMGIAIRIAYVLAIRGERRFLIRIVVASQWASLAVTLLAVIGGLALHGTSATNLEGTIRLLTAGASTAAVFVALTIAALMFGLLTFRTAAIYALPGVMLLLVSSSRNVFITIGVAILLSIVALLARRGLAVIGRVLPILLGVGLALTAVWLLVEATSELPLSATIRSQVFAFIDRAVLGLGTETLTTDPSILWRERENAYLWEGISQSPLLGHGLGYVYQPTDGALSVGFGDNEWPGYFSHNFYLWLWVNGGLVLLSIFLIITLKVVVRGLFDKNLWAVALSATAAGILSTSFVAPAPMGYATTFLLGGVLGVTAALTRLAAQSTDSRKDSVDMQSTTQDNELASQREIGRPF